MQDPSQPCSTQSHNFHTAQCSGPVSQTRTNCRVSSRSRTPSLLSPQGCMNIRDGQARAHGAAHRTGSGKRRARCLCRWAPRVGPRPALLIKLELAGVLISKKVGRTRVFEFNPRIPTARRLKTFLASEIDALPNDMQARDQAIMVARHQEIDWDDVVEWGRSEGISEPDIA